MNTLTDIQPAAPFSIGLKPLNAADLLQIDDQLPQFRAEKLAFYEQAFDRMCMAEADTLQAQQETESLIRSNLITHHPDIYQFEGRDAYPADGSAEIRYNSTMPIASTALLIQDDLIIMRRDDSGWRLVAASLCFPSSWNLQEKFGHPLESIHGPVPMNPVMTNRINRVFDGLQPTIPVWRANWSLDADGDLRHDRVERHRESRKDKLKGEVFFRTEYQTLHKLPQSQDVLFTIRIKTGPITDLLKLPDGSSKIAQLHNQFLTMTDAERDYKGINRNAEKLLRWFSEHGERDHD